MLKYNLTSTLNEDKNDKPDARNKSVKLLLKYAQVTEFPLIPHISIVQSLRSISTSTLELVHKQDKIPYFFVILNTVRKNLDL